MKPVPLLLAALYERPESPKSTLCPAVPFTLKRIGSPGESVGSVTVGPSTAMSVPGSSSKAPDQAVVLPLGSTTTV